MAVLYQSLGICLLVLFSQQLTRAEKVIPRRIIGQSFELRDGDTFRTYLCMDYMYMTLHVQQDEGSSSTGTITFTSGDVWREFSRVHLTLKGQRPQHVIFDEPDGSRNYVSASSSWSLFPFGYGPFWPYGRHRPSAPTYPVDELQIGYHWIQLKQGGSWRPFAPRYPHRRPEYPISLHVKVSASNTTSYSFTARCHYKAKNMKNSLPVWFAGVLITPLLLLLALTFWHMVWNSRGDAPLCLAKIPALHFCFFGAFPGHSDPPEIKEDEHRGNADIDDFFYYRDIRKVSKMKSLS